MLGSSRRRFMKSSAAVAAGFIGLKSACHPQHAYAQGYDAEAAEYGYGYLFSDPRGILDLPKGFTYSIISQKGDEMDDGLVVPGAPDGMAALPGPYGLTVIIRNHELTPTDTGAFGEKRERLKKISKTMLYDPGLGDTPGAGGTSTIVYDTKTDTKIREFLSLAGTIRNCAGGPTPWKTWITCEETVFRAGEHEDEENDNKKFQAEKDHGYNFEVPVSARMELTEPIPLTDMGRFNHEAVAVDPRTGIVYQTEDRDDGIFYRFLPTQPGNLKEGGKLQALVIKDKKSADTRNWKEWDKRASGKTEEEKKKMPKRSTDDLIKDPVSVGQKFSVEWIDMDDVTSPEDDLRVRGFEAGAARFARGEGIWYGNGEFFFACTSGGKELIGQIWRYRPSYDEGTAQEKTSPGELELFIEPNDTNLVHNADNLTVSPWGDLIVCEDRDQQIIRLVGITPEGKCYPFAMNHMRTEFAGVTFSPDGSTLFVNLQHSGHTVAIRGPWQKRA